MTTNLEVKDAFVLNGSIYKIESSIVGRIQDTMVESDEAKNTLEQAEERNIEIVRDIIGTYTMEIVETRGFFTAFSKGVKVNGVKPDSLRKMLQRVYKKNFAPVKELTDAEKQEKAKKAMEKAFEKMIEATSNDYSIGVLNQMLEDAIKAQKVAETVNA